MPNIEFRDGFLMVHAHAWDSDLTMRATLAIRLEAIVGATPLRESARVEGARCWMGDGVGIVERAAAPCASVSAPLGRALVLELDHARFARVFVVLDDEDPEICAARVRAATSTAAEQDATAP